MARTLSLPLALVLAFGYLLTPVQIAQAGSQVASPEHGDASPAQVTAQVAPASAAPTEEPPPPDPTPTAPQPTATAPQPTATATPKPTPTPPAPAATATPKPTPTPPPGGGTPKPTIPPKPEPSPGVMPKAIEAKSFARVVNTRSLVLRESPRAGATAVIRVPKGQIVGILGTSGKWYHATFRGRTGYGQMGRLQLISLAGTKLAQKHPRIIVVDRRQQHMEVYENGRLMIISAVTTGRPELPTPLGMMKVMRQLTPYLFRSPWPETSPFWYPPGWADYAVLFRSGGFYFHDTRARPSNGYGIGSNVPHVDPDGVTRTGSRGCVNTPWWAMQQLFGWVRRGDVVAIIEPDLPPPSTPPGVPSRPEPQPQPPPPPPSKAMPILRLIELKDPWAARPL